jgi:hypothetical protein
MHGHAPHGLAWFQINYTKYLADWGKTRSEEMRNTLIKQKNPGDRGRG